MPTDYALEPVGWSDLRGWQEDDLASFWPAYVASAQAVVERAPSLRVACEASEVLRHRASEAVSQRGAGDARRHIEGAFSPHRIRPRRSPDGCGFLTGYYEPEIDGALEPSAQFIAPVLARPSDLDRHAGAYPTRSEIRRGAIVDRTIPVVWLRDDVEVFFAQVQGSARVRLADGRALKLIYDGRNGRPYTSIGKVLVERGLLPLRAMSLASLKAWLRANGVGQGGLADDIMDLNESYVFFRAETRDAGDPTGPIGGQGLPLTDLRSIAVDRSLWSYGLPFWVDAEIPWRTVQGEPFRRLMLAQDTGTAIVGPARLDIYFGSGAAAGDRAGDIRHPADVFVLLPRDHVA